MKETFQKWMRNDLGVAYNPKVLTHRKLKLAFEAATPKWQPIKTAPKDGTRILVAVEYARNNLTSEIAKWDKHHKEWRDSEGWKIQEMSNLWQPLPTPP